MSGGGDTGRLFRFQILDSKFLISFFTGINPDFRFRILLSFFTRINPDIRLGISSFSLHRRLSFPDIRLGISSFSLHWISDFNPDFRLGVSSFSLHWKSVFNVLTKQWAPGCRFRDREVCF